MRLFYLFMYRVFTAVLAKFFYFYFLRMLLLVLSRRIIPVFAFRALQCNNFSHSMLSLAIRSKVSGGHLSWRRELNP